MNLLAKILKIGLSVGLSSSLFFLSMNAQADMARMNCLGKDGKAQVPVNHQYFLFQDIKFIPGGGFTLKAHKVIARGRFCTPGSFPIQFSPCVLHLYAKPIELTCESGSSISMTQTVHSIRYTLNADPSLIQKELDE